MKIPVTTLNKYGALLLCLLANIALAQDGRSTFKYLSRLPKVDSAGYYRINLAPGLTGRALPDIADVRLVGTKGTFVPYVKSNSLPITRQTRFVVFLQVQNKIQNDSSTTFIAQNTTGTPVNQLWLRLKNTAVNRHLNISGSDDQKNWFAITEDLSLSTASANDNKGAYQQRIDFPSSNFKYLKLTIPNKSKSPLAILGTGIYTDLPAEPKYVPITGLRFSRADSPDHSTHLRLKFDLPYRVDRLSIPIVYNGFFHREVNVYTNDSAHTWLTSKTFSNDDKDINLSIVTRGLDIQIINNDDAPLPVKRVSAYQNQSFLIARLEPGISYYIIVGDPEAKAPKYDLEYFADHLTGTLPEIIHQNMQHNPMYKRKAGTAAVGGAKKNYWLWAGIAVAIAVLSGLTVSMLREVKKREQGS